jgi:hypothetical protein
MEQIQARLTRDSPYEPLPAVLAQAMLRILDRLVDMGDRRSAALQASELFRNQAFRVAPSDLCRPAALTAQPR